MIETAATFNEEKDGYIPPVPGVYPGHISSLISKEIVSKAGQNLVIFNLEFVIAEEVEGINVPKMVKTPNGDYTTEEGVDGLNVMVSAKYMAGKKFKSDGIFFTPNPGEGENWKNNKYKEYFESLGVEFPKSADGTFSLGIVEDTDVLGKPCLLHIDKTFYMDNNGIQKSTFKVMSVSEWQNGATLSADEVSVDKEKLPF